jgi:hypothetical protein
MANEVRAGTGHRVPRLRTILLVAICVIDTYFAPAGPPQVR